MSVFTEKFHAKKISVAVFRIYGKNFRITEKMFITLAPWRIAPFQYRSFGNEKLKSNTKHDFYWFSNTVYSHDNA